MRLWPSCIFMLGLTCLNVNGCTPIYGSRQLKKRKKGLLLKKFDNHCSMLSQFDLSPSVTVTQLILWH